MPIQATNYDATKTYNIAEISDVTPPQSLTINGDFQVNQRGQASYTNGGYNLDMWKTNYSANTVTVNADDTVTITNNTSDADITFTQNYAELDMTNKQYTLCVGFKDDDNLYYVTSQKGQGLQQNIKAGVDVVMYKDSKHYGVLIKPTYSATVDYIKLYEGTIAYKNVKEDYATALMRCYEKVYSIQFQNYSRFSASFNSETSAYVTIPFSQVMKNKPLISYSGVFKVQAIAMKGLNIANNECYPNMLVLYVTFNSAILNWQTTNYVEAENLKIIASCEEL